MTSKIIMTLVVLAASASANAASAAITPYRGFDAQADWEAVTQEWNTIDFTGFEPWHHLSDEYEEAFGVVFTDDTNAVVPGAYQNDGWGLTTGSFGDYAMFELAEPVESIAFFHPGALIVTLWLGEELVGWTGNNGGSAGFLGLTSDVPFDRVRIDDQADIAYVDDIRIGMAIPGPGAAGLIAVASVFGVGRRRRGS